MSKKVKRGIQKEGNGIACEDGIHVGCDHLGGDQRVDANFGGASIQRDIPPLPFGVFLRTPYNNLSDKTEEKPSWKNLSSKTEALMGKKRVSCLWTANQGDGSEAKTNQFAWPWLHRDEEDQSLCKYTASLKPEKLVLASVSNKTSDSVLDVFSFENRNCVSSSGSTNSVVTKFDMATDILDYEILWEDLTIGQQIGRGKYHISNWAVFFLTCLLEKI